MENISLIEAGIGGLVMATSMVGTYWLAEWITPKKYNQLMEDMRLFWAFGLGGYVALGGRGNWLVHSLIIGSALGAVVEPRIPPLSYFSTKAGKPKQQKRKKNRKK